MSRQSIVDKAITQLGRPYFEKPEEDHFVRLTDEGPAGFDCSFFTCWSFLHGGKLELPRNSHDQFLFCKPTDNPIAGDLGFFADKNGHVYHVGLVVNDQRVIEARFPQKNTSFDTGKVIYRPFIIWAGFNDPGTGHHFAGWRSHPQLV